MAEATVDHSCARDRVRFERRKDPDDAEHDRFFLYDGSALIREVGTQRSKILDDEARRRTSSIQRRIHIVESKKVLMKGDVGVKPFSHSEPAAEATPSCSPSSWHQRSSKLTEDEEEEVPEPVRISTAHEKAPLDEDENDDDEEEDDDGYFTGDTMCAWCDDGGNLLMCDGPCMRAFHVERECNPLKIPEDLRAAIVNSKHPFECPNCWSRTHRCFKCQREYKLDVTSDKPMIVKCDFADCGKFYCRKCQDQIVRKTEVDFHMVNRRRGAFVCPLHFCCHCGTAEDTASDLLFPCKRCPKAMHESCMPRKIRDNPTRIWKAAVSKDGRLLEFTQVSENFFYCENHQTQNMMQGPVHDAPLFSETLWKKWRTAYALKFRCLKSSEPYIPERNRRCLGEDLSVALAALNVQRDSSKSFENEALRIAQKKRMRPQNRKSEEELRSAFQAVLDREEDQSSKRRSQLRALMESSMNSISMQDVENELMTAFPYHRRRHVKLTEDRLDFFIHSVNRATFDPRHPSDLVAPKMIEQMKAALKSMRISCAPFLHPRYTSYGRHFTKTPILKHIAQHVIGYLKPGDLVVDFSCGANEFIGIIMDFCKGNNFQVRVRAYDLFTPFRMDGFVRKNWFDVTRSELDKGENLVVGLNPPFGVNAFLANRFVLHAAKLKPRLMMLICPPETIVPEEYSIIHEDNTLCKDKAFYIPGMRADQRNGVTPPFRILKRC